MTMCVSCCAGMWYLHCHINAHMISECTWGTDREEDAGRH